MTGSSLKQVSVTIIITAAITRQVYLTKSNTYGIGKLKSHFGKKYRRGSQPPVYSKAAGKIIREVITQLRKVGYVENFANQDGTTLGLTLTRAGRAELDKLSSRMLNNK